MEELVVLLKHYEPVVTPTLAILGLALSIAAIIVSVKSNYFVRRFAGPILRIRLRNNLGDLTDHNGIRTLYHHLAAENDPRREPATETVVHITRVERRRPDGEWTAEFEDQNPMPLVWQRRGYVKLTLDRKLNCDIGYLQSDYRYFVVTANSKPHDLDLTVSPGRPIRLTVEVSAENAVSEPFTFEIAWDGIWAEDRMEMAKHLVLKPVLLYQDIGVDYH